MGNLLCTKSNTIDDEPNADDNLPTKMEISPPIHLLPNELLVKIMEKLPRPQWPSLELVDHKFRDAVELAWGSLWEVDIERDFIYSKSKAIKSESDDDYEMIQGRLRRQSAQKTEAILKKLYERSPFITSLIGLSMITGDPTLNTTAIQYLSRFQNLETIKFTSKSFSGRDVNNGRVIPLWGDISLLNLAEFVESTQSRASLKEIDIRQCDLPSSPFVFPNFDRLRAAFANVSNDPTRQLLRFESLSMRMYSGESPFACFDNIDTSNLTELSLWYSDVDPAALTNFIKRAPQLRHLDFAFLGPCNSYINHKLRCNGERLQPTKDLLAALESLQNLTSLGFNSIWPSNDYDCSCRDFEAEFKQMLQTIAPQLVNFVFTPGFLPPDIPMSEIRDIIQNHMPSLKSIKLDSSCAKDPEELRGIADGKDLEEIEFAAIASSNDNYETMLNEVMSTILSKSPRLKRFIGRSYYPDQRVAAEICKLSDLTALEIRADRLTEENFIAFSQQVFAEKLELLRLGDIGEGVESGLIELVGKARQLRALDVDRNVTDKLLECVVDSCPNLEVFSARPADGITFEGIQILVDRCTMLRCLNTARFLKKLKLERYRKLEYINQRKFFRAGFKI